MKVLQRLYELQDLELGPRAGAPEARRSIEIIRKEIPEPVLKHYDRLMDRGKKGVALVRHGVCNGCQMKIASGPYAALLRDDDIAMCDNCARYLLLATEESLAPPPAPRPTPPKQKPAAGRGRKKKPGAKPGPGSSA
jgi:hypothetical protein